MSASLGVFIVIEGPNGVGKTTVCAALARTLTSAGVLVHATAEPTRTPLGRAIRELEASMPPKALALSCAADRYDHVIREIQPQLDVGFSVICDRYVPSSLVLQRIDGLALDWIWNLHTSALRPDLTVYLEDDPKTISIRLDERGRHSRFEERAYPAVELDYYREARDFLAQQGWNQTVIDCRSQTPVDIAAEIAAQLPGPPTA